MSPLVLPYKKQPTWEKKINKKHFSCSLVPLSLSPSSLGCPYSLLTHYLCSISYGWVNPFCLSFE